MSRSQLVGCQDQEQRLSKRHVAGTLLRKLFHVPVPGQAPTSTSASYLARHGSPCYIHSEELSPQLLSIQSCPADIQMLGSDDDDDFENSSDTVTSVPSTECGTHSDVEDLEVENLEEPFFGSADFDLLTCPGAQAEQDAEYIRKVYSHPFFCGEAAPPQYGTGPWFTAPSYGPVMPSSYAAACGHIMQPPMAQPSMGRLDASGLETAAHAARLEAARLDAAVAQLRSKSSAQAGTDASVKAQSFREAQASGGLLFDASDRTTVMMRNLPNEYTREMLLELLDEEGFRGKYDFIYLPLDLKRMSGLGHAFVNMVDPRDAKQVMDRFNGFTRWTKMSKMFLKVAWGEPVQGLDMNLERYVERYQNDPVMHPDVPDEAKPALFSMGVRVPFPPPTKKLWAPRMKALSWERPP